MPIGKGGFFKQSRNHRRSAHAPASAMCVQRHVTLRGRRKHSSVAVVVLWSCNDEQKRLLPIYTYSGLSSRHTHFKIN